MSSETDSAGGPHARTLATLTEAFGDGAFTTATFRDNLRLHVPADRLIKFMRTLKERCGFTFLSEVGGADYLDYPGGARSRYEVHYVLRNLDTSEFVVVKVGADDPDPEVPSVVPLWAGADWMEREVFDMYGVRFAGHPDLRRILMPPEFAAFPLRKDYPLRGRGERHNFPRLTRNES